MKTHLVNQVAILVRRKLRVQVELRLSLKQRLLQRTKSMTCLLICSCFSSTNSATTEVKLQAWLSFTCMVGARSSFRDGNTLTLKTVELLRYGSYSTPAANASETEAKADAVAA